jgi:hypothetical protein
MSNTNSLWKARENSANLMYGMLIWVTFYVTSDDWKEELRCTAARSLTINKGEIVKQLLHKSLEYEFVLTSAMTKYACPLDKGKPYTQARSSMGFAFDKASKWGETMISCAVVRTGS